MKLLRGQWELKNLTNPKLIKSLTTPYKIIQHMNRSVQIEFNQTSKYSFTQDFLSARPSTSNTNLNSFNFSPKIPILVYQQQKSLCCQQACINNSFVINV